MIYNINFGIGWASSGVEYAQIYRAKAFRKAKIKAKFIFLDMINNEPIESLTKNIGFKDSEVLWIYQYFTDYKYSSVKYNVDDLVKTFPAKPISKEMHERKIIYKINPNYYVVANLVKDSQVKVFSAEHIVKGFLIKKDYFTTGKLFTEFYSPKKNEAKLYERIFYNRNGSIAYKEFCTYKNSLFVIENKIISSKEDFVGYFIKKLNLSSTDTLILDRSTGIGQVIFENANDAKIGVIVHADHFSETDTTNDYILWNNYYEYEFNNQERINFYVTSTDHQTRLMKEQFLKYKNQSPKIITIPVGCIDKLQFTKEKRKPYSLITASRLAPEKHIDWLVRAVVRAKKSIPNLTLDIYGQGIERKNIEKIIEETKSKEYIKLCGHKNLKDIYKKYEVYIAASTSEGFGLTLLEACSSGLAMLGFDIRYGNTTFIDENNGIKIKVDNYKNSQNTKIRKLSEAIEKIYKMDLNKLSKGSYKKAEDYLLDKIAAKWKELLVD